MSTFWLEQLTEAYWYDGIYSWWTNDGYKRVYLEIGADELDGICDQLEAIRKGWA